MFLSVSIMSNSTTHQRDPQTRGLRAKALLKSQRVHTQLAQCYKVLPAPLILRDNGLFSFSLNRQEIHKPEQNQHLLQTEHELEAKPGAQAHFPAPSPFPVPFCTAQLHTPFKEYGIAGSQLWTIFFFQPKAGDFLSF